MGDDARSGRRSRVEKIIDDQRRRQALGSTFPALESMRQAQETFRALSRSAAAPVLTASREWTTPIVSQAVMATVPEILAPKIPVLSSLDTSGLLSLTMPGLWASESAAVTGHLSGQMQGVLGRNFLGAWNVTIASALAPVLDFQKCFEGFALPPAVLSQRMEEVGLGRDDLPPRFFRLGEATVGDLIDCMLATGVPLFGVMDDDLAEQFVLGGPSRRAGLLREHSDELVDTCEQIGEAFADDSEVGAVALDVREAVEVYRRGQIRAAQALATTALGSLEQIEVLRVVGPALGGLSPADGTVGKELVKRQREAKSQLTLPYPHGREKYGDEIQRFGAMSLARFFAWIPCLAAYRGFRFYIDPVPEVYNRHATAHGFQANTSPENALTAMLVVASWLWANTYREDASDWDEDEGIR